MKIAGETGSVEETLSWLRDPSHKADIIFMDVELSDGNCFEIFRKTDFKANVIMTTAYDNYAVKAFEVESIDYLLKPVEEETLKRAVDRCLSRQGGRKGGTRKRILVKLNDTIVPVLVSDIAYLYAEDKSTYLVTKNKGKYIVDFSLEIAMEQLDHETFYRISRNCIISMQDPFWINLDVQAVYGADQCKNGSSDDIFMNSCAPGNAAVWLLDCDISAGLGI